MNITDSFDILGLKPATRRVLMALIEKGTLPAADIANFLNLPKSTVYDSLSELTQKSLVVEYSNNTGKTFAIPDKEQLVRIHKKEISDMQSAHEVLISFLQHHKKESSVAQPKIKFYAGVEGIKQAFRDMSWTKEYKEAYLMWPMTEMINTLGEDFLQKHGEPRYKLGVIVNSIQKHVDRKLQTKEHEWLKDDLVNKLRRVRYVKKGVDWQMSYWIYGNKCLFASGGVEKFAFMIQSKEFADIMKLMWQEMWKGCEEL